MLCVLCINILSEYSDSRILHAARCACHTRGPRGLRSAVLLLLVPAARDLFHPLECQLQELAVCHTVPVIVAG